MSISMSSIAQIRSILGAASPRLCADFETLISRSTPTRVQYVEITHSDGTTDIVPASEYARLTATDLAHTHIRVLTESEANQRGLC